MQDQASCKATDDIGPHEADVRQLEGRPKAGEDAAEGYAELPIEQLVPGDIVRLSAGDMIPADLRLLAAKAVFLINGITKRNWLEALLFAVAVAVGLTPEMLPMIVTVNLAKGALAMSRRQVIVERLNAIQNFGAMDTLCTDKTGTLTQDRIILKLHLDIHGHDSARVLEYAYLNSHFQSGLKNLLDITVAALGRLSRSWPVQNGYVQLCES